MGNNNFALTVVLPVVASLALYVWTAASLSAVFAKAGEQGWQAWVPILNTVVLLRLGGLSGWWVLLALVPVVGALALAVVVWTACHRLNAQFGVGPGMTVVAVLVFPVWSSILGWGSARWLGHGAFRPGPVRAGAQHPQAARAVAPGAVRSPAVAGGFPAAAPAPLPVAPAVAPFPGRGMTFADIPPRPTSLPPAPPIGRPAASVPASSGAASVPASAGAASVPAPAGEAFVPAPAAAVNAPVSPVLDDVAPIDSPIRRRRSAPTAFETDPVPVGAEYRSDAVSASSAPYTGTIPTFGNQAPQDVPAGPRRAVAPAGDTPPPVDDLLSVTHVPAASSGPVLTYSDESWAPPAVRTPRYSPALDGGVSETSAEISAVIGSPSLGMPMSARSSVSALRDEPELPDAEGAFDETIIAARRRTAWMLTPPLGAPIPVTSDVLIVGRRPSTDPASPHAQLVRVADETRTMSKTHARLELRDDVWTIVDLDSTNGVVLVQADGRETELMSGRPEPLTETFLLGDAELRLTRSPGVS